MDIIIKGMEMPTTCCDCKLIYFDETRKWEQMTGAYVCQMTGKVIWNTRRGDDCPLIELTPHGRLIDADALRKRVKTESNPYGKPTIGFDDGCKVMDMIDNAPTIIEAEGSDNNG